ncbi:hypothetical protein PVK06_001381 [Gossypium arboreum]|uniref:Uncharacterized protein n=1 Tax=Gossypium arboreum TaxID=29729 RepID=A0ABR0R110_GOSAR|nr:hypothetical protein PVK06_001381 [Gossypium arboreum]
MYLEEEYYINLHVWVNLYVIPMLGIEVVKHKEIDLYVEHEINIVVFVDDESTLVIACLQFGSDDNEGGEGGEVVGSKCGKSEGEGRGGEVVGSNSGEGEGEGEGGKSDGGGEEGVNVAASEGGESDGSGEEGVRDESDSDSKYENAYLMKVMYLSDCDDDEEL